MADWGTIPAVVSAAAAIVALALTVREKRSAKRSAGAASAAEARAIAAAQRAADAQTEAASALTRMAELAEQTSTQYNPPWRLEHYDGDTYALWNNGVSTEYDVTITGQSVLDPEFPATNIDAGSKTTFMAYVQRGARTIEVKWSRNPDGTDPQPPWRDDLPARPAR